MKIKALALKFLTTAALIAAIVQPALSREESVRPNVLFIFSDDQSYETIRAFGHTDIETPNLDRLVARGTTFTHAYNMGAWNGAVCVASRTMLLTGRTVWRARSLEKKLDAELEASRLWPQRMAAQGYETFFSGKWHINTSAERCFAHTADVRLGMPSAGPEGYDRPLPGVPDPWSPSDPKFGGFWKGGKHWSEVLGDDGVRFLEQAATSEKPFFMYLAFNAPHDPRQSPEEYVNRYPLDRIKMPRNFLPEYPQKEEIGCGPDLRDEKLAPFPRDENAVKVHRQEYYAIITHMDAQIGRILDALEKSGQADNTWIFFTSDHGLAVGHHGLMGKQNMYDHSLRVPFIVSGPGAKAGVKIDAPIYLQDAMATALDLAGADREGIEFQSLRPLLAGEGKGLDAVYGAYLNVQRAIVRDGWKLILYPDAKVAKLYHLAEDPQELKDLASDPATAGRQKALFAKLRELQKDLDDKLDLAMAFSELR
jgi:arylsulfatase A-like enzyme